MWNSPEGRVYSHTSLDLWRQCHRRWYHKYVLGHREPTTDNMAAGTWLCQEPIECWERDADTTEMFLQFIWANFLAEFGGTDDYDSPLFTPDLPKQILAAYKASPVDGKVVAIEETYYLDLVGGGRLQSKPDLVVERERLDYEVGMIQATTVTTTAWDIKLKTFGQRYKGDTAWLDAEALSEFDDQGLSQLAATGADSFGQIQFWLGKKDGVLHGPFYVERTPSRILVDEWKGETAAYIREIEVALQAGGGAYFQKNPQSCKAFGRACAHLEACAFGFQGKRVDTATGHVV